jgi:preprotein translocase subunit SecG
MIGALIFIHVTISVLLIMAVLLQQGKGASMGILSSAGQSWFGPAAGKSLLMKMTIGFAVTFLICSVLLTLVSTRKPIAASSPPPVSAPAE